MSLLYVFVVRTPNAGVARILLNEYYVGSYHLSVVVHTYCTRYTVHTQLYTVHTQLIVHTHPVALGSPQQHMPQPHSCPASTRRAGPKIEDPQDPANQPTHAYTRTPSAPHCGESYPVHHAHTRTQYAAWPPPRGGRHASQHPAEAGVGSWAASAPAACRGEGARGCRPTGLSRLGLGCPREDARHHVVANILVAVHQEGAEVLGEEVAQTLHARTQGCRV